MNDPCPVDGCKIVQEHHETLYGEPYGIKACLKKIDKCLLGIKNDKISKKSIWSAFLALFFVLVLLVGVFTTMWADTRYIEKDREYAKANHEKVIRLEERVTAIEKRQDSILRNTEDIKQLLLRNTEDIKLLAK